MFKSNINSSTCINDYLTKYKVVHRKKNIIAINTILFRSKLLENKEWMLFS